MTLSPGPFEEQSRTTPENQSLQCSTANPEYYNISEHYNSPEYYNMPGCYNFPGYYNVGFREFKQQRERLRKRLLKSNVVLLIQSR